jgi:hypothetical protein
MEHWHNDAGSGKQKYWAKDLSQCHSVHHMNKLMNELMWKIDGIMLTGEN